MSSNRAYKLGKGRYHNSSIVSRIISCASNIFEANPKRHLELQINHLLRYLFKNFQEGSFETTDKFDSFHAIAKEFINAVRWILNDIFNYDSSRLKYLV